MRNLGKTVYGDQLRKEIAPKGFTTQVEAAEKERVMRACLEELGTTGKGALQIIDQFVSFCKLLANPANHIVKRSGQHVRINMRTEAYD